MLFNIWHESCLLKYIINILKCEKAVLDESKWVNMNTNSKNHRCCLIWLRNADKIILRKLFYGWLKLFRYHSWLSSQDYFVLKRISAENFSEAFPKYSLIIIWSRTKILIIQAALTPNVKHVFNNILFCIENYWQLGGRQI